MIEVYKNIQTTKRDMTTSIRYILTKKRKIITAKGYITTAQRNISNSIKERKTSYKKTLLLTWVLQDAGLKEISEKF